MMLIPTRALLMLSICVSSAFCFFPIPRFTFPSIPHFWAASPVHPLQRPLQQMDSLDGWLMNEERVALDRLLANIAPRGRHAKDAAPGSVIASPSRDHPNYFYQWVRDAAITISTLVDIYIDDPFSHTSIEVEKILEEYATLQDQLQHTSNPSGKFDDLYGLGEPKFEADGLPFTQSWGRPQPDGPALRAITLMAYVRAFNASHPTLWNSDNGRAWFARFYHPALPPNSIIKADLEYVSHFWNTTSGFDLWEEVQGLHFFTAMVQHRALKEGAALAKAFGDTGAAAWYRKQAEALSGLMRNFWSEGKGHLIATMDTDRSGLDCALLLGSMHGFLSPDQKAERIFPPYSDEILLSLLLFVRDQHSRFPINASPQHSHFSPRGFRGTGLGRYPEDQYDGYETSSIGNPWFLCTASAAEILYRTAAHLHHTRNLSITNTSLSFYSALLHSSAFELAADTYYDISSPVFSATVKRLKEVGDEFLDVVRRHADVDGALSEQFDRVTGFQRGARDLTWSYGALLQAVRVRKELG